MLNPLVLDSAPASDYLEDQRNHGQYQQNMDETSQRETGQHSKKPENEQDCEDSPKHLGRPTLKLCPF